MPTITTFPHTPTVAFVTRFMLVGKLFGTARSSTLRTAPTAYLHTRAPAQMSTPYASYPLQPSEKIDHTHTANDTQHPINVQKNGNGIGVADAAAHDASQRLKNKTAALLSTNPLRGKVDNRKKLDQIARDFRSDTITIPTEEMLRQMTLASRGDDVYGEDDTTNSFQAEIAALTGKESAIFVSSGTLSNQLALRTHLLQPPYTVLCDTRSHIFRYEASGIAFHCGAATEIVAPSNGHHLRWEQDILPNLSLDDDIHFSPTRIISLENTLHGTIFPQDEIIKISNEARHRGIIMHLDGARLWNVAAETGLSIKELCDPFESVSLCLSKGLGAPIGSILVGSSTFIKKVRHFRKLYGGGVRQLGPLVAAARVAVLETYPKLQGTHQLARYAAQELEKLGVRLTAPVETNMVFLDTSPIGVAIPDLVSRAAALPQPIKLGGGRMVVHHQISKEAIDDLLHLIHTLKSEGKNGSLKSSANGTTSNGLYSTNTGMASQKDDASPLQMHFRTIESIEHQTDMKHAVSLVLPFPDDTSAITLQNALSVDKELKPSQVRKQFQLLPAKGQTGVQLRVDIFATTVRQLRLSVNAFLEDAALVCRTMSMFDPAATASSLETQLREQAEKLHAADELEQGSVGLAG